jgi:hypothetical protein
MLRTVDQLMNSRDPAMMSPSQMFRNAVVSCPGLAESNAMPTTTRGTADR